MNGFEKSPAGRVMRLMQDRRWRCRGDFEVKLPDVEPRQLHTVVKRLRYEGKLISQSATSSGDITAWRLADG